MSSRIEAGGGGAPYLKAIFREKISSSSSSSSSSVSSSSSTSISSSTSSSSSSRSSSTSSSSSSSARHVEVQIEDVTKFIGIIIREIIEKAQIIEIKVTLKEDVENAGIKIKSIIDVDLSKLEIDIKDIKSK